MNHVGIIGNLTRDVELRYLPSGSAVANFTIANNRKWKDQQSGEMKEEVSFIGIVVFGKQAETVAQYFKKGSPILVEGRLKQESWEDKQTQKKQSKTVVVMEKFFFMGGGRTVGTTDSSQAPAPAQRASVPAPAPAAEEDDSDVPF